MPSLFDKFTKSMKQLFSYKSEDDDFSEDEMNKNKRLKICSTQNETLNDIICSEFSTICYDAFEEKVIEIGLRDNDLFTSLRPHIFDSFKYNKSFNSNQKIYFKFLSTRKMVSFKTD